MSNDAYQPIPVSTAVAIAQQFKKSEVIIIARDAVHERLHVTTYGASPDDKLSAAQAGDAIGAYLLGIGAEKRETFADFRHINEATWAERVDRLVTALRGTDAVITKVIQGKPISTPELQAARDEAQVAINATIYAPPNPET